MQSVDAIWLEVKFRSMIVLLCCIYRAPSKPFWNGLSLMTGNALGKYGNITIVGDINENQFNNNCYLKQIMLL